MNDRVDGAADRVAALAARHRHAADLARYASLAVRIDTPLLRRLRLEMLPGADASAEAELWFSTLSESRGDDGLVLDGEVAAWLRERLAAERLHDGTRALDTTWRHTAALHAGWPASLRLEERLTYLALAHGADAGPQVEEALQPAMVAMASGEQRATEVARWAVRAVPRLPAAARDSEAAVALALAAMAVLDGGGNAMAGAEVRAMPPNLGWLLPAKVFTTRAKLACEVSARGLRLRAARSDDPPHATIELPLTRPLMLELRWTVDGQAASRLHRVAPGETVALPKGWRDLRVRTLTGSLYAVEPSANAGTEANYRELVRACVRISSRALQARGVVVGPGWILVPLHAVGGAAGDSEELTVQQGRQTVPASVGVTDSRVDLALLQTRVELADARPISRAGTPVAPGDPVVLLAETALPSRPHVLPGRVAVIEMRTTVEDRQYEDLLEVRLEGDPPPRDTDGLSGSPFLRGNEMVGMLGWRGNGELYATSMRTIDRFLGWAMRPPEHFPDILFSYAPDDEYGKGREMDSAAVERIQQALLRARLRSALTEDMQRAPESELGLAFNRAEGAVCLFTPVATARGEAAERELAAIAFRRWADPSFPVALATFRSGMPPQPVPLRALEPLVVDSLDGDALWQQLQDRLDGESIRHAPRPSEEAFHAAVEKRFSLPSGTPVDDTMFDRLIDQVMSAASLAPPGHAEAVADAELLAMAALPSGETLRQLRQAAEEPPGKRAIAWNAMPVQFARLAMRKAWYPRPAPPHVVIRDPQGTEGDDVAPLVAQVVQQVAAAMDAPQEAVAWVLARAEAAYAVIFATRPLPGPRTVAALQAALPGALLFFLGVDAIDREPTERLNVAVLPFLSDATASLEWMRRYKRMMDVVAPRGGGGDDPRVKRAPSRRKSSA